MREVIVCLTMAAILSGISYAAYCADVRNKDRERRVAAVEADLQYSLHERDRLRETMISTAQQLDEGAEKISTIEATSREEVVYAFRFYANWLRAEAKK
jgi:Tfp pilus assembly protein PilE